MRAQDQKIKFAMQKSRIWMPVFGLLILMVVPSMQAQLRADSRARLEFSPGELSVNQVEWEGTHLQGNSMTDLFKKRKKRKRNTLALGLVAGGPVGFGGRVVFRPSRLAVAGDIAYSRIRTDDGPLIGAMTAKIDARFYSKGFIARLLRTYAFAGMTVHRGRFNEVASQSVLLVDGGIGGGIKLWRLEINAEVGLLVPAIRVEAYKPRLGVFANVGVLIWVI
jgi:hypothetical protein